jgi:hypothetical protein
MQILISIFFVIVIIALEIVVFRFNRRMTFLHGIYMFEEVNPSGREHVESQLRQWGWEAIGIHPYRNW